jgi:hypothetical protein
MGRVIQGYERDGRDRSYTTTTVMPSPRQSKLTRHRLRTRPPGVSHGWTHASDARSRREPTSNPVVHDEQGRYSVGPGDAPRTS